jgi:transposase
MTSNILGIDVSKDKLDCALLWSDQSQSKTFDNDLRGFQKLHAWLREHGIQQLHAALESTGSYGRGISSFLHQAGYTVSIVNPRLIHGYSKAMGLRNKTDKIDARLIAQFCKTFTPPAWVPRSAASEALQQVCRLIEERKLQRVDEQNRLEHLSSVVARKAVIKLGRTLDRQIEQLEHELLQLIAEDPGANKNFQLLQTIPGIGKTTAAIILAELPPVDRFASARKAAAFAGLTPQVHQSGTSVSRRSKLTKIGNRRLRRALYLPAVSSLRYNPVLRLKAERLKAKGKSSMCVIGAIMHQLLRTAFGVLKNQQPFDANWKSSRQAAKAIAAGAGG